MNKSRMCTQSGEHVTRVQQTLGEKKTRPYEYLSKWKFGNTTGQRPLQRGGRSKRWYAFEEKPEISPEDNTTYWQSCVQVESRTPPGSTIPPFGGHRENSQTKNNGNTPEMCGVTELKYSCPRERTRAAPAVIYRSSTL